MATTMATEFSDRVERQIGRDPDSASTWLAAVWWGADDELRAAWGRTLAELGETGSAAVRAEVLAVLRQISGPAVDALVRAWLEAPPPWLADPHPTRGPGKTLGVALVEAALGDLHRQCPELRPLIAQRARAHGLEDPWLLRCLMDDPEGAGRAAFAARVATGRPLGSFAEDVGVAVACRPNHLAGVAIAARCGREDRERFFAGIARGFRDEAARAEIRQGLGLA